MDFILAPLRGVTIRSFRETFATEISEAGFHEAITPFVAAMSGYDPLKDRELASAAVSGGSFRVTPQFIGKDPAALRTCLRRIRAAGYETADLNCGCPFPMVRNKGRGSGILRTPDVLRQMLEVGCEEMGPGKFSIKTRLGVERTDELLSLMPLINLFPLRFLTLHARTARQMYEGACDWAAFRRVAAVAKVPLVANGDLDGQNAAATFGSETPVIAQMIGREFVRALGARADARELLTRYVDSSVNELSGDRPVLGRIKELLSYWKEIPAWRRKWDVVKICRTVDELRTII